MLKSKVSRVGKYLADKKHRYVSKVQKVASNPTSKAGKGGPPLLDAIESVTFRFPSLSGCWLLPTQRAYLACLLLCLTSSFLVI